MSVCLETGNVVSFDATGYISNHTDRENPTLKISEKEAQGKLNKNLMVIDTTKCVKCGACISGCHFGAIIKR